MIPTVDEFIDCIPHYKHKVEDGTRQRSQTCRDSDHSEPDGSKNLLFGRQIHWDYSSPIVMRKGLIGDRPVGA